MTDNYKNSERPKVTRKKTIKTHKINTNELEFDFNDVPDLLEIHHVLLYGMTQLVKIGHGGDEDHPEEVEEKENYFKEVQRINVFNRKKEKEYWKIVLTLLGKFKEGDIIEDCWADPTEKYIIGKDNNEFVVNIYWD